METMEVLNTQQKEIIKSVLQRFCTVMNEETTQITKDLKTQKIYVPINEYSIENYSLTEQQEEKYSKRELTTCEFLYKENPQYFKEMFWMYFMKVLRSDQEINFFFQESDVVIDQMIKEIE